MNFGRLPYFKIWHKARGRYLHYNTPTINNPVKLFRGDKERGRNKIMAENQKRTDDYDSPWKEGMEIYFKELMEFFFPAIASEIDWNKGYEFLDKEFQSIVRDAEIPCQETHNLCSSQFQMRLQERKTPLIP